MWTLCQIPGSPGSRRSSDNSPANGTPVGPASYISVACDKINLDAPTFTSGRQDRPSIFVPAAVMELSLRRQDFSAL